MLEILLATLVSRELPKSVLPAIYLKIAYFGWRMNGLQQACKRLNLNLDSISIKESAALIARLKYPEPRLSPKKRTSQIYRRRNYLIKRYRKHYRKQIFLASESRDSHEAI